MKPVLARQMEVYAGFDGGDRRSLIGRPLAAPTSKILDDTASSISSSAKTAPSRLKDRCRAHVQRDDHARRPSPSWRRPRGLAAQDRRLRLRRRPTTTTPSGWAHAMDSPDQWTKQGLVSYFGGTRNGTVVHWPTGHPGQGEEPRTVPPCHRRRARRSSSWPGCPARSSATASSSIRSRASAWRSVRRGPGAGAARDPVLRDVRYRRDLPQRLDRGDEHRTPWLLIGEKTPAFDDDVWELYDTEKDWSQSNDLSQQMPDKLHELQRLWLITTIWRRSSRSSRCSCWRTTSPASRA